MFFNKFIVFGHRGNSSMILENTLESFRFCCQADIPAVEFDVMLTADGVPVVFHDETLDRLANMPNRIDSLTASEISKIRLKKTYVLPTFDETLDLLKTYHMPMNIEIKPSKKDELTAVKTARVVVDVLKKKDLSTSEDILFSSFSRTALTEVAKSAPQIKRGLLIETSQTDDFDFAKKTGAVSVHIPESLFSDDYVVMASKYGLKVCVYTVNNPASAVQMKRSGVVGVFSDNPVEIMKAI